MFEKISQFLQSSRDKNDQCCVCHINCTLRFTFILLPIRGKCHHLDKNYSGKPCFQIMNHWLCLSYVIVLLLLAACFFQFRDAKRKLTGSDEISEKIDGIIAYEELSYLVSFLMIYSTSLLLCRKREAFLNSVVDMMENVYFIEIFGPPWNCFMDKEYKKKTIIVVVSFIIIDTLLALLYQQSSMIYIDICFFVISILITAMGAQVFRELGIIMQYRYRIDKFLINRLKYRMGSNEICVVKIEEESRPINFDLQLQATELYYSDFYTCIKDYLNSFMGPVLLLWCTSSLIMLVLDFYIMVLLSEKGLWHKNLMEELRTYLHVLAVILLMNRGSFITGIVSIVLS